MSSSIGNGICIRYMDIGQSVMIVAGRIQLHMDKHRGDNTTERYLIGHSGVEGIVTGPDPTQKLGLVSNNLGISSDTTRKPRVIFATSGA